MSTISFIPLLLFTSCVCFSLRRKFIFTILHRLATSHIFSGSDASFVVSIAFYSERRLLCRLLAHYKYNNTYNLDPNAVITRQCEADVGSTEAIRLNFKWAFVLMYLVCLFVLIQNAWLKSCWKSKSDIWYDLIPKKNIFITYLYYFRQLFLLTPC